MIINNLPNHVAIIPDGNRRWAKDCGLPTFEGHRKGFDALIEIGKKSRELGIKILTAWAFSTENWDRSKQEIKYLMELFELMIDKNLEEALKNNIKIIHLGRKDRISKKLKKKIINAENKTKEFNKYYLCIGLDYGGRDEIVRTISKLNPPAGGQNSNLSEYLISKNLDTKVLPFTDPDLIIRTGGEQRLSGFMLWQAQYSELMFIKKYLPDFTPQDFENCIKNYSVRQRRFGK
ncbi:MAG: Isoprenyl transferase [Candidatus Roizmanbacteria bacterium GW2011_GWA2_35_19]|uniref:Isoprenyl transferase n=2 Tax=Candidatus Roizmaniibacteriota TaxID=1752723 RepID=A0A0G0BQF0_9BACT|nr:MAG: Isoprenyl transferase [Candidatus Roizmanbacteria bacterium GW2011_GWC2_35_12]KKP71739.1 MAG: Isoprenyl transferase [Candidatus Roizmanbacteria bacterium GW2011_GWA2_35_19]